MLPMDQSRDLALLALHAITGDGSEDLLIAERLQDHEMAAQALSVLAGYLLQALAMHRREDAAETARFVERSIRRGPDDGLAGVPARI